MAFPYDETLDEDQKRELEKLLIERGVHPEVAKEVAREDLSISEAIAKINGAD
jgi:hypothetical protein